MASAISAQFRAAAALRALEQIQALGWHVTTSWFRAACRVAFVLLLVTLLGMATLGSDLLRAALSPAPPPPVLVPLMVALVGCASCAGVLRGVLTRQRDLVARPINVDLFRAVDLSAVVVFALWVAWPIWRRSIVMFAVLMPFLVEFAPEIRRETADLVLLAALPLAAAAIETTVAAWLATRSAAPRAARATLFASALTLAAVLGRWAAGFIGVDTKQLGADPSLTALIERIALAGVLSICVIVTTAHVRRLIAESFPVRLNRAAPASTLLKPIAARSSRSWIVVATLVALLADRPRRTRQRIVAGLAIAATLAFASSPALRHVSVSHFPPLILSATFTAALALTEVTLGAVGSSTLASQHRAMWEAGISRWWLAATTVVLLVLDTGAIGAGFVILTATIGMPIDPGPVLVGVATAAALALADAVVPPIRRVDGSTMPSLAGAALGVVLMTPVLGLLIAAPGRIRLPAAFVAAVLLIGGGIACIAQAVTTMPHSGSTA